MKLILAVDAISPPLTGIGRYAWELASRLEHHPDVEDIRFFSMGAWVRDLGSRIGARDVPTHSKHLLSGLSDRFSPLVRKYLSQQLWAIQAYSATVPNWMAYRLRACPDHLYHSPNFFLPPTDGRTVATIHDLSNFKYPETHPAARRKLFDLEMGRTLRHASHLITPSETTRHEVAEYFSWPEERITAILHGVHAGFRPRAPEELAPLLARHGLEPGGYSLCVSTLEPRKRILELLTAFQALPPGLRRRYPLVLVGSAGWLNESIYAKIEIGQREGWGKYLGFVPEDDLANLYAGAQAFLYPSVYEGYGLPVVEAMASGVPVLTSDKSCLPEVSGGAAWLVDPDNHEELRDGIAKVLSDDPWRETTRLRGLAVSRERTWEHSVQETLRVYAIALGEQGERKYATNRKPGQS